MRKTRSTHALRRSLKLQHGVALALALLGLMAFDSHSAAPFSGRAKVVDGDSLVVNNSHIRLWGIDAPELDQNCQRGGTPWACGKAAKRALQALIAGKNIRCTPVDKDKYKRAVCRCSVDGQSLSRWMVKHGFAVEYRRYSDGAFTAEEADARSTKRGIWSGNFAAPEQWRHQKR